MSDVDISYGGIRMPRAISFDIVLEGKPRTVVGASSTGFSVGTTLDWPDVIDVEGTVVETPNALPEVIE